MNDLSVTNFTLLPKALPIKKLGDQYKKLTGNVKLSDLTRLGELINQGNELGELIETTILVNLEFKLIDKNKITIDGYIDHEVTVDCQRCLQPMPYRINSKIAVVLIDILSRIDKNLSDYEPVLLSDMGISNKDNLDLYKIIEDEMILSLPTVPKHAVCKIVNWR